MTAPAPITPWTVSSRLQVPVETLATWFAQGWRLIYAGPAGQRVQGEAAVIEWTPAGRALVGPEPL